MYIFAGLRQQHRPPIKALYGLAGCMRVLGQTPEEVAHSLAFLQIDLTEKDFLEHAQAASLGFRAGILGLLRDAKAAGQLHPCSLPALARAIQSTLNGAVRPGVGSAQPASLSVRSPPWFTIVVRLFVSSLSS